MDFPVNPIAFGWIWILLGFLSGMIMGLKFADEQWLGGYSSHPRRLVRLAHISFFGLGAINLLWGLSLPALAIAPAAATPISIVFVIGAVTMPTCCLLMAWNRRLTWIFTAPVLSLLTGAVLVVSQTL